MCGGVILADSEDWDKPVCCGCHERLIAAHGDGERERGGEAIRCDHPEHRRLNLRDSDDNLAQWCQDCGRLMVLDEINLGVAWLPPLHMYVAGHRTQHIAEERERLRKEVFACGVAGHGAQLDAEQVEDVFDAPYPAEEDSK